jgi:hypothetical protein
MPIVNDFGIIPVARGLQGKLLMQNEIACSSEEAAKRAGRESLGGAVAFRSEDDPEAEIIGQGVIIGRYGLMAEKADEH